MTRRETGKEGPPPRRRAELRFTSKADFLKHFLPDVGIGGFQWVTGPLEAGTPLELSLSFIGHPARFTLSGVVVWRHSSPPQRPELPAGVGIEFDVSCRAELHQVLKFAMLKDDESTRVRDDRRQARIRVRIECRYLYQDSLVTARVKDISEIGLYIETNRLLPEGTRFIFYLLDDHILRPLVMEGVVVWMSEEGEKPGFGVQLIFDSLKHKTEHRRYVNGLGAAFEDT